MRLRGTYFVIILLSVLSVFSFPAVAHAQTTYEQLLDAYRDAFDTYKQTLDQYNLARAEYLKYQTQVSQDVAIDATKKFLNARQQVLITYLRMMKERLEQSPELTEEELKEKILYINQELDFLEENQPLFDNAQDLGALEKLSKQVEGRYKKFTTQSYFMKGLVIDSKVRSLEKTANELISLTSEQVARIKKENVMPTDNMERWIIEANRKLFLSQADEETALTSLLKTRTVSTRTFGTFINNLMKVTQYHKEINDILLEIVQDIRFD